MIKLIIQIEEAPESTGSAINVNFRAERDKPTKTEESYEEHITPALKKALTKDSTGGK